MHRAVRIALVLTCAAAALAAPPAPLVFGAQVVLAVPAGEHPIGLAIADVTGDGNADVIQAPNDFARLLVYAGNGAGAFGSATNVPTSRTNTTRVRAVRLNADAAYDLVLDHVNTAAIDVLLSDGLGGFTLTTNTAGDASGSETDSLCLADWDGDGDPDIVTGSSAGKVRVRLNDGAGTFAASQTIAWSGAGPFPSQAYDVVAADLDGDGDTDVALREATATGVYWRQGDGSLAAGPRLLPPQSSGFSNHGIAADDFDGDGLIDVAEMRTVSLSGPPRGAVNVFRHTAATTFAGGEAYPINNGQWDLATADLNGDLLPEIATPTDLLVNQGNGTFTVTALPATGWGVATGNVDADARPDIAIADVNTAGHVFPVRTSGTDPFVTSFAPSPVYVGALRTVTLTGSGFVSGATVSLGTAGTVDRTTFVSGTSLTADVRIAADATPGPAVAVVTNPAGGQASVAYRILAGGAATVGALSPDHANAGDLLTVTVSGTGFVSGVTADLGDDVDIVSALVVDETTVRLGVTMPKDAAAGPRDLTLVNGTGVPVTAPAAFTVVRAPTLDLTQTSGRLTTSNRPFRDTLDVRGKYTINAYSIDGTIDPKTETVKVQFGDALAPQTVTIPSGTIWKVRRKIATWKSAPGAKPSVAVTLDLAHRTFRSRVTRADLTVPESHVVLAGLTCGTDFGSSASEWTASKGGTSLSLR